MTIHHFDTLPPGELQSTLFKFCSSPAWVLRMSGLIPFEELVELLESAEEQWYRCSGEDWKEALMAKRSDQDSLHNTDVYRKDIARYEEKFGFPFLVSPSGKSPEERHSILLKRMKNDPAAELKIAAEEQNKITKQRIRDYFERN